ncbi:prolyl oligopeptidase family serine peptidase [Amycolatopsis rubida]|uniref:Prolyl oligopeptidase n=1 Tax=Amycolatopsis rubida TaxID=112413 RepID=A0A1I5THG2_9PSEU|nr:prolyl oligopeptidase family serine peptidase [Amycolatopsis rubida]SFP81836.1 prolyl oligopeptidase [Amycolatopsis rubida]
MNAATGVPDPAERLIGQIRFEDPYEWLEADSPQAMEWQREQDARAAAELSGWAGHPVLRDAVAPCIARTLGTYAPLHRGEHWFRLGFAGEGARVEASDQPVGPSRVVVDPVALGGALDWFQPSPDGAYVAFGLSFGGDEQSVLHVVEVGTGELLPERIPFASSATVAWLPDSSGFYYNGGVAPDTVDPDKRLFFHRLGDTVPSAPEPITVREAFSLFPQVSGNGRWLAAVTSELDPRADLVKELPAGEWRRFLADVPGRGYGAFAGDQYVAILTDQAPRGRLVGIPVATATDRSTWRELLPESDATMFSVECAGDRLVLCELVGTYARLRVLTADGTLESEVPLPGRGVVMQLSRFGHYLTPGSPWMGTCISAGAGEFTFVYSSPTRSPGLYRYDCASRQLTELVPPDSDRLDLVVHDRVATAADGTVLPYQLVCRRGLDLDRPNSPQPALIYGYGGFNVSFVPGYLGMFTPFVDAGGVLVLAHVRGGGELGEAFWKQGRLGKRQTSYDDLYATAEHLVETGVTSTDRLALVGSSNGGLLASVALTQRPDLWRAVCALVPLCDMLAYTRDAYTSALVMEFGDPDDPAEAQFLYAYSPYHNVRSGAEFPATLFYCGANDVRCAPWHARKLAARLRDNTGSAHPILLRAVAGGGHQTVKYDPGQVAEWLGFLFRELGLTPMPNRSAA